MKNIAILGVTGSIGRQTIEVVTAYPHQFNVVAIAAGKNTDALKDILNVTSPKLVSVLSKKDADQLQLCYPNIEFCYGDQGLIKVATYREVDIVLNAVVGFVGLIPTIEAIKKGKDIALANKETLVVAGHIITQLVKEHNVKLLPVDSEHSAIFQCLNGENHQDVQQIILTASGGSLKNRTRESLVGVTKEEALAHPNWSMGNKITIDSATMFNKGLEIIEAKWLFNVDYENIKVYIHPESVVHSMVEFVDGGIIAQLGVPDMKLPIQYALTYPCRMPIIGSKRLRLEEMSGLHFECPDFKRFKSLEFAYTAGKLGGSMPCVLNGANEQAVQLFLNDQIEFLQIEELVEKAMSQHQIINNPSLEQLIEVDQWARDFVMETIREEIYAKHN